MSRQITVLGWRDSGARLHTLNMREFIGDVSFFSTASQWTKLKELRIESTQLLRLVEFWPQVGRTLEKLCIWLCIGGLSDAG